MVEPATKTLAELKKLSMPDAATLLLRRLVRVYPMVKSAGGLNKGNLMGPSDPYALAADFPRSESFPVREYLLGTPWTMLVNFGCIVDPRGTGFYSITDQGFVMAEYDPEARVPRALSGSSNKPIGDTPTVFVSYSWDSELLKEWVLQFATRLQEKGGVKVILDQWYLRPGTDRTHFMESSIKASDFVLVVCTPDYAAKSNARSGGAGYEAMIITAQLAHQVLQSKFIPVLRAGKWGPTSQPAWIDSKIGVDLSGDPYDENQYEDLLRELHRSPIQPPPVGPRPIFSDRRRPQSEGQIEALERTTQSSSASLEIPTSHKGARGAPPEYVRPADSKLDFADHASERMDDQVGGGGIAGITDSNPAQIWNNAFHLKQIFRLDIFFFLVSGSLAVGGTLLIFDQFTFAAVCFGLTGLLIIGRIVYFAYGHPGSNKSRVTFAVVCSLIVGGFAFWSVWGTLVYAKHKERSQNLPTRGSQPTPGELVGSIKGICAGKDFAHSTLGFSALIQNTGGSPVILNSWEMSIIFAKHRLTSQNYVMAPIHGCTSFKPIHSVEFLPGRPPESVTINFGLNESFSEVGRLLDCRSKEDDPIIISMSDSKRSKTWKLSGTVSELRSQLCAKTAPLIPVPATPNSSGPTKSSLVPPATTSQPPSATADADEIKCPDRGKLATGWSLKRVQTGLGANPPGWGIFYQLNDDQLTPVLRSQMEVKLLHHVDEATLKQANGLMAEIYGSKGFVPPTPVKTTYSAKIDQELDEEISYSSENSSLQWSYMFQIGGVPVDHRPTRRTILMENLSEVGRRIIDEMKIEINKKVDDACTDALADISGGRQ